MKRFSKQNNSHWLWFSSTYCCVRCWWKSVKCYRDVVVTLPQLGTDNRVGRGRHVLKLERPRLQHEQWLGFVSIISFLFPSPQEELWSEYSNPSIYLPMNMCVQRQCCLSRVFGQTPCWPVGRCLLQGWLECLDVEIFLKQFYVYVM